MSKIKIGTLVEVGAMKILTFTEKTFKVSFGDTSLSEMLLPELKDLKSAIEAMIFHLEYLEKMNNG